MNKDGRSLSLHGQLELSARPGQAMALLSNNRLKRKVDGESAIDLIWQI